MNTTKKVDREKWIQRAASLMKMNSGTRVTNSKAVLHQLRAEFGISRYSAETALMQAAMRARGRMKTA